MHIYIYILIYIDMCIYKYTFTLYLGKRFHHLSRISHQRQDGSRFSSWMFFLNFPCENADAFACVSFLQWIKTGHFSKWTLFSWVWDIHVKKKSVWSWWTELIFGRNWGTMTIDSIHRLMEQSEGTRDTRMELHANSNRNCPSWVSYVVAQMCVYAICDMPSSTLLVTKISFQKGTFEDDFRFSPGRIYYIVPWRVYIWGYLSCL